VEVESPHRVSKFLIFFYRYFRRSYLSRLFQTRGLSHTELATVFLPPLCKFFSGSLPQEAVEIGLFPGVDFMALFFFLLEVGQNKPECLS